MTREHARDAVRGIGTVTRRAAAFCGGAGEVESHAKLSAPRRVVKGAEQRSEMDVAKWAATNVGHDECQLTLRSGDRVEESGVGMRAAERPRWG